MFEAAEAQTLRAPRLARKELTGANPEWALDFAHGVLAAGRTIRVLSVIDLGAQEKTRGRRATSVFVENSTVVFDLERWPEMA